MSWGSTALLLLVWGFASSYPVAGLVPVNTADNYFHILDATVILFALLSPRHVPSPDVLPPRSDEDAQAVSAQRQ